MITVVTPYSRGEKHDRADEYRIDDQGNLILSTSLCGDVAVYAAGSWTSATVQPNRGPDGRFTKRAGR